MLVAGRNRHELDINPNQRWFSTQGEGEDQARAISSPWRVTSGEVTLILLSVEFSCDIGSVD